MAPNQERLKNLTTMNLQLNFLNAQQSGRPALLLSQRKEKCILSLIKRSTYEGPHSGQISFPGGKPESNDKNLWQTALRECKEELGVLPKQTKPLLN